MTDLISKTHSVHPAGQPEARLFDDWIDPIETGVRERVRDWIEALIEAELDAALGRPRYGRAAGDGASRGAPGYRHGRRSRTLTGTFGQTEISVPRARLHAEDGTTTEWRSAAPCGPISGAPSRRCADCLSLSGRHQHPAGAPGAGRPVRRSRRQGHGQPGLAQGADRLAGLEPALARRRADRPADPRRHGGAGPARQEGHLDLAPGGDRRPRGWAEGAAVGQEHGRRDHGRLACGARRSCRTPVAPAGFRDRGRRARPGEALAAMWDGVPLQRCTVHKHRNLLAHAPKRLYDEITADYTDMIYAATVEEIEERRKAFLRKWRLRHRAVADSLEEAGEALFAFTKLPPSQWKSARTTNAIERLHEEFKRRIKTQTVLPSDATAAMLFWALLASGQITMRKVDGWKTLPTSISRTGDD